MRNSSEENGEEKREEEDLEQGEEARKEHKNTQERQIPGELLVSSEGVCKTTDATNNQRVVVQDPRLLLLTFCLGKQSDPPMRHLLI